MAFMGSASANWKELAAVRARAFDTRTKTKQGKKQSLTKNGGLASNPRYETYKNGKRALCFDKDACGFAYYPSGSVAAVVTKAKEYTKNFFFYGDKNEGGKLLCFVSEKAEGFAIQNTSSLSASSHTEESQLRLVWNADRGVFVENKPMETLVRQKWRWDPEAMNAGTPPTSPIVVRMSSALKCSFLNFETIKVTFERDNVLKTFDCGLKVKRTGSYLDKGNSKRDITGKVVISPRRIEHLRKARRDKKCDDDDNSLFIPNQAIREVMGTIDSFFQPFNISVAVAPDTKWKTDALEMTRSEVPTIEATGQEIAVASADTGSKNNRNDDAAAPLSSSHTTLSLVSDRAREGKKWLRNDGKMMNNLEIHRELMKLNPTLERPNVLVAASGRYSRDAAVKTSSTRFETLRILTSVTFDKVVRETASHLVVVACLRKDDLACRKAEQVLEKVNGRLCCGEEEAPPYVMTKFEMSESNFLKRRYNVQTVPMYLMYFGGKLVYGGTLGGAPIRLSKARQHPPFLMLERSAADQIKQEKILRKLRYEWDLASDVRNIQHHMRTRRASGGFSVVMLSMAGLSSVDVKGSVALFCSSSPDSSRTPQERRHSRRPLIAVVVESGSTRYSRKPIYDEKGKRYHKTTESDDRGRSGVPTACLKTRIVDRPPNDLLCGAHVLLQKPLTAATMTALKSMWKRQDFAESQAREKMRGWRSDVRTHVGLSAEAMIQKMRSALEDGRRGKFVDTTKPASFGTSLSGTGIRVCDTDL